MRDIYVADPPIHAVGQLPVPEGDDEALWREAIRSVRRANAGANIRSNA